MKKKVIIIVSIILVIGIVSFFVLFCNNNQKTNDLEVEYSYNKIKFNDFSKNFTKEETITIKNTSNENRTYTLKWVDVKNSIKNQYNFTYEIKGTGKRSGFIGKSQVPVSSATVFKQVLIEKKATQSYKIIFNYNGSDEGKFTGRLVVESKKEKKSTDKEKKKELEKLRKEHEKRLKEKVQKKAKSKVKKKIKS